MLLVPRYVWETLRLQADHEGLRPGEMLDRVLRSYLEKGGCEAAVSYLHDLAESMRG